jgi:hypothetical protein
VSSKKNEKKNKIEFGHLAACRVPAQHPSMNLSASAREVLKTAALLDKFHLLSQQRQRQLGEEMRARAEAAASSQATARARVSQINAALRSAALSNASLERQLVHDTGGLEKVKDEVERKQSQLHDLATHVQRNRLWLRGKKEQIAATGDSLQSMRSLIRERQDRVAAQEGQRKAHLETLHTLEMELGKAARRLKQLDDAHDDASHQLEVAAHDRQKKQRALNDLQHKLQRKEELAKLQAASADAAAAGAAVELRKLQESVSDATCRIRTAQSRKVEALQRLAQRQRVLCAEQQDLKELLVEEAKVIAEISQIVLASDAAALGAEAAARQKENAKKNRFDRNIQQQEQLQQQEQEQEQQERQERLERLERLERQEQQQEQQQEQRRRQAQNNKETKFVVSTTTAKKHTRKRRRIRGRDKNRDKNKASTSASVVRRIRLKSERVNTGLF